MSSHVSVEENEKEKRNKNVIFFFFFFLFFRLISVCVCVMRSSAICGLRSNVIMIILRMDGPLRMARFDISC
jgi:hypothetical protein